MITVTGKVLGRKKPLFADWSIPFPPDLGSDGGRVTLRDLITRLVLADVEAFRKRQKANEFVRALTAADIEKGVARGKVDMGGRKLKQDVNDEEAIGTALQAFEDGLYLVVVDGEEQGDLDKEVFVKPESRVTFVRLVMLAGGEPC